MSTFDDFIRTSLPPPASKFLAKQGIISPTAADYKQYAPGLRDPTIITNRSTNKQRPRVPFIFTSDKRLYMAGAPNLITTNKFDTSTQVLVDRGVTFVTYNTRPSTPEGGNTALIRMSINPKSVKWTQEKRITKKDTITGSTYQHFLNPDDQNNDVLKLDFAGTTGNIQLTDTDTDKITNGLDKLKIFHQLYNLTREEKVFLKNGVWTENHFHIIYETVLFPMGIRFMGFFNSVMSFEENAEDPLKRDYSFTFIVESTTPGLDELDERLEKTPRVAAILRG